MASDDQTTADIQSRPLRFGDPIVCIFASEDNPGRNAIFVRWVGKLQGTAEVTDGNGKFWRNGSVIHAEDAHLFGKPLVRRR